MRVLKRSGLKAIALLLKVSLAFACSGTADDSGVTFNTTDTCPVEQATGVTTNVLAN